jgi:alpha/beta superfamily hydrolase
MTSPFPPIHNADGERLDVTYHPPSPRGGGASAPRSDRGGAASHAVSSVPRQIVVLAHGVTSNKDRPWLIAIAESLAAEGIASLRMSFAGNGESEGRYEDAMPSKEAGDLGSVIDVLIESGVTRVAYAGHSMGGAVGVLRASRDGRIDALVSLAGMVHVAAFMQRHCGHLTLGRDLMFDKPGCPWTQTMKDDAERIGSLLPQASRIAVPWLLVHGDADELVPLQDALDAREAAGGRPDLITLPGVDHRFTGALPAMVDAVVPWLVRQMLA